MTACGHTHSPAITATLALFCFGQFDLGPQHVDFGDDADFKLQFHVLQDTVR